MKIKVGSRESKLAMAQANIISAEIKKAYPAIECEIVPIKTSGDKILDVSLDKIGGKGLFVNELEKALLDKSIDIAVHSMKDLPSVIGLGLTIAVYSKREDHRDVFISTKYKSLNDMPCGSILGTSSLRRRIQALNINPDLNIKLLRGNIITRLNKLDLGEYDGIIIAMAGLKRLNLEYRASYIFSIDEMVTGVCQGIIGVETRLDSKFIDMLYCLDNKISRQCAMAERAFMKTIDGSCSVPMGAYAQIDNDTMSIHGFYYSADTERTIKHTVRGLAKKAEDLGIELGMFYKSIF